MAFGWKGDCCSISTLTHLRFALVLSMSTAILIVLCGGKVAVCEPCEEQYYTARV